MNATANTSPSQPDFLGSILERLNGTVTQISRLRQSLANLEIELISIRHQCENAQADVGAAAAKAHDGDRNTIIHNVSTLRGHPSPVPLKSLAMDRDPIQSGKEHKRIDRRRETPLKRDPPSSSPFSSPPFSSSRVSSSRVSERSGSQAGHVVKARKSLGVLGSLFRTTRVQAVVHGLATLGAGCKPMKNPPIPTHPLRTTPRPPTQPSPFPEDRPEFKQEGDGWFLLYNPSHKVKSALDVNLVHTFMHDSYVYCAKFSRDGKWLATGCRGTAQIYNVETGVKTRILDHKDDKYIGSVTFSPDGKYLATGGQNKKITVWDIANQKIHDVFRGHQSSVPFLHFSPNCRFIISGSLDGTVRIWDVYDRTVKVLTIEGHYLPPDHRVSSVAISPDGRYVAVGSVDMAVSIWEVTTGVQVQTLRGHTHRVRSVAFTPDGKGLISGSWDSTLKYWDVSGLDIESGASTALTGTSSASSSPCLMNLTGHKTAVNSTAVSHDGTWIVSGSGDGNVLFWDARTGVAQCALLGHTNDVVGVDLSPMGHFLATADWIGKVRIWNYGEL